MSGTQHLLMATIKINFLISHENILKFGLEIITWPQNQKKKTANNSV